jgi:Ca2+-binding EF-hand superfamily protein
MSNNAYWLTQLTKQKKPEDFFTKLDQNQDGSLDTTELKTFAEKLSGRTGQTVDEATLLSMLDTNRDGIIGKDEFIAGKDKIQTQFGFPNHQDIFKKFDANQDGSLDMTELQTFASDLSQKTGKTIDANTLITTLDTNKDGVVSATEFKDGKENVQKQFGLHHPSHMKKPDSSSSTTDTTDTTDTILSDFLANLTGIDANGNPIDSSTSYQTLSKLLLNSYIANNAGLLGKNSTLNLFA